MMTSHYFIIDSPSDSQNPLIFDSPSDVGRCGDSDMFDSVRCRMGIGADITVLFSPACVAAEHNALGALSGGAQRSSPLHVQQQRCRLFSTTCAAEMWALLCYMCSRDMGSSPLHLQRKSGLFSATCVAEKWALLR